MERITVDEPLETLINIDKHCLVMIVIVQYVSPIKYELMNIHQWFQINLKIIFLKTIYTIERQASLKHLVWRTVEILYDKFVSF